MTDEQKKLLVKLPAKCRENLYAWREEIQSYPPVSAEAKRDEYDARNYLQALVDAELIEKREMNMLLHFIKN